MNCVTIPIKSTSGVRRMSQSFDDRIYSENNPFTIYWMGALTICYSVQPRAIDCNDRMVNAFEYSMR